jgi:hypothetical protein
MIFSEYNTRFVNTLATEIEEKRSQLFVPPTPRTSPLVSSQAPLAIVSSSTIQSSSDNTSNQTPPIKVDKELTEQRQQQQQHSSVKPWHRKKLLQQPKEPLIIIKETPKRPSEFQSSQPQQQSQSQSQLQPQQLQSQLSSKTTGEANLSRRERDKVIAKVTFCSSVLDITFSKNKN